jgi:hypothetical protein
MNPPQGLTLAQSDRLLKIMQAAFGLHMVFVVFMAERLQKATDRYPPEFEIPFIVVGVGLVVTFFFVRTRLPLYESVLQTDPADRPALGKRQQLHVIIFAVSAALVLFGFVTRFMGASILYSGPFYGAGILLLLLSSPRKLD